MKKILTNLLEACGVLSPEIWSLRVIFVGTILVCLAILTLLVIIGGNISQCGLNSLENKADKAANKANRSLQNRLGIQTNLNVDLKIINSEKEKSNANINSARANVDGIFNAFVNHDFSSDELERLANDRRGRR